MIQISGSMSGMVRRRRRMEWYVAGMTVVVVVWIPIIGSGYTLDGGIVQWCKGPCRC